MKRLKSIDDPEQPFHNAEATTLTYQPDEHTRETRRGEWRTHFYIPVALEQSIDLEGIAARYFPFNAELLDNLHVSLSRPCSLRKHEIGSLTQRVRKNLVGLAPFELRLSGENLVQLAGENGVTFGGMMVMAGKAQVNALIDAVDEALTAFGKQGYYDDRILHCSFASWATPKDDGLLSQPVLHVTTDLGTSCRLRVNHVLMRSGHLTETFTLG